MHAVAAGSVVGDDLQAALRIAHLADCGSGEVIASFALTEDGAGSNPAGLTTKAVRDGAGWVIDGAKRFITNAPLAGLFVVNAGHGRSRIAQAAASAVAEASSKSTKPSSKPSATTGGRTLRLGN